MVKNYKKNRKTKKIRRKTKRIKRKTQRGARNHKKLIGGMERAQKPKRTYLVIGSLSNDAENELHKIIESMDNENNSFDVSLVFILERASKFTPKEPEDIINVTISIIKTDILNYVSKSSKNIEINLEAQKFMISSTPPEAKIEMETLEMKEIEELFSTSDSIIIINSFVFKEKSATLVSSLREAYPDRLDQCYKYDENLFLECIPQIIPLIIGHKGKIYSIYTQIIGGDGGHQQFAKLDLIFYYYFITNLYNTGYTLSEEEKEFVEIYLTQYDSFGGRRGAERVWYQKCLRDIILNL